MEDRSNMLISEAVRSVLTSFAARENATVEDVLALARSLPAALGDNASSITPEQQTAAINSLQTARPAVAIDQSVSDDTVTCLCCGKSFTMLKRHLKAEHGLSEQQYRAQFGLPEEHLLVAPNYSIRKAEYAKRIGLGKYAREDSPPQDAAPTL
ncbi:MucR family transcriptional regulator [Sulfitobacter geojensis]|uniref:MucR family transcriptional regulator n=2 Tax=Sulfitobacter geojensis TaxID=1342299 RepID=A0AAE2VY07_9RHOB|nr:MucR family transcriptional regulator [Sulfitobacter geojensis]MBM1689259.1 MucR family transcriptional regulator [Sulfitobacter geojensis]MBM1693325.1 MucR family transcriptional regulator [Sulfitobacter geojensis]MBM1705491.1 MucR family transcriptional regulator [Sulfitobacter geojensis]MBM1709549.1 MucR family transcriptional regulator [Sulfitobacter geojensis]MBM1713615.1 MucR family transcriptional regulator [Sulfitobacter geojensis]